MSATLPIVREYLPQEHGARCDLCPLKGNTVVPPKASATTTKLVFVGEAPGRKEEIQGAPFVGMTGQFLRGLCREVDIDFTAAALQNASLCLHWLTRVRMGDGTTKSLGWIVKNKYRGEVMTVESDGRIGRRHIVGWHRNPLGTRRLLNVTHDWARQNRSGPNCTTMTDDHLVLTRSGWSKAGAIRRLEIATGDFAPAGPALDVAYGTLLGDAHIPANRGAALGFSHAVDQEEYALMKARLLRAKVRRSKGRNGWQAKVHGTTYVSSFWRQTRAEFYVKGRKRIPRHVIDRASDLLVAIWFLDDGYMRFKQSARKSGSNSGMPTPDDGIVNVSAEICAAGYPRGDVAYAVRVLRAKGFDCKLSPPGRPNRILFQSAGARAFSARIARFVPTSMRYKLLPSDRHWDLDTNVWYPQLGVLAPFFAKATVRPSKRTDKTVYCIDVAETHNFITSGAVVHNCRSNIDKENELAAVCCAPRLLKELAVFDKSIPIVTLGKTSTLSVLGVRSIMHSRGFVWTARKIDPEPAWKTAKKAKLRASPKWKTLWLKAQIAEGRSKLGGRTILPTVHPAFVLRSDTWLPILKIDLDRVSRWVRGELLPAHLLENGPYVVVSKRKDIRRELRKFGPDIDVDVETGASTSGGNDGADPLRNRLLCVGISDGDHTVVIWPWRKTFAPIVNALLKRSRSVGMHNGYNFDQLVLDRYDVPFKEIEDKLEDTLIAHHTFASHMPQRLSHVASCFVDAGPWKITFKQGTGGATEKGLPPEKLDPAELCKYNAADARIQARTRQAMRADLADELDVYAVDKENARLCRSMIVKGIGVDLERRSWLHDEIVKKQVGLEEKMRKLLRRANFHPLQLADVRKALFTTLGASIHIADPTDSGLPSTSQTTLEKLKSSPTRAGRFADLMLQWRGAAKIDGTYVKVKTQRIDRPSKKTPNFARTHLNWRSYGAASGRYSCRLQSCPRAEKLKDKSVVLETRVREMYVARPGCKFIYFDLSQAELRFAAYLSGDPTFIAACESGDVHTAMAKLLFPTEAELIGRDPKGVGKPFRDVEKNCIFGCIYYAEADTLFTFVRSKGLPVEMRDVVRLQDMVRGTCSEYYRYVERNKRQVDKDGFMRCALSGRISWLGWHAGFPDVANRPIQGGIASLMNVRLPAIARRLPAGASVVAQIHDAAIMEVPERHVARVEDLVKETWEEPVVIPVNGWGTSTRVEDGARSFVMPIESKIGERWSDFG